MSLNIVFRKKMIMIYNQQMQGPDQLSQFLLGDQKCESFGVGMMKYNTVSAEI